MNIEDQKAGFAIFVAVVITFIITVSAYEYIKYNKLEPVDSSVITSQIKQEKQDVLEQANSVANEMTNELQETEINEEEVKSKNEEEYEKLKKENKISSKADKYYIKVNYGAQVVTVYTKDSNGKYTKPVKAMICSTGTHTPKSGTYRTLGKQNWWRLKGGVYGQYSTQIVGNILFHSVPYLDKSQDSLEYWEYDKLRNILFCWLYQINCK